VKRMSQPPFGGSLEAWNHRFLSADSRRLRARWQQLGLRPGDIREVYDLLAQSYRDREMFESKLRDAVEARRSRRAKLPVKERIELRRRQKVLREALRILETDQNQYGRPVWRGPNCEITKKQLRKMLLPVPSPPRLPKHRIGEEWAPPIASRLASIFDRNAASQAQVTSEVLDALRFAGHDDSVITRELIRHIIRQSAARLRPPPSIPAKRHPAGGQDGTRRAKRLGSPRSTVRQ
jgi:hypothetical protein